MSAAAEATRRRLLFGALYLCEGAPIGFVWWALPTILRERGVPVERIGALASLLVLPWALKFLWAPVIDLGHGRGLVRWIAGAQLVMAATLLPLLGLDGDQGLGWITAALLVHALAAASQDAAIDSLALRTTPAEERGRLNGWMQLGMLLGRALFGGGALVARRWVGDAGLVLVLVAGLGAAAVALVLRGPAVPAATQDPVPLRRSLVAALRRRTTWLGLLFAATSGAGFEAVGALAGPFLIDRGLASADVGLFLGLPAVGAMALGALAGGHLADRSGVRRTVLVGGIAVGACVLLLAALAGTGGDLLVLAVLTAIYAGLGLFTAASYALFMALTDPELGATQFSAYMGATNLCESWSARLGGTLAQRSGYASAFAWPAGLALAALPLLLLLAPRARAATGSEPGHRLR
ncbi:MAG TPA: MFS transporter [Planctomycetota bacterium]